MDKDKIIDALLETIDRQKKSIEALIEALTIFKERVVELEEENLKLENEMIALTIIKSYSEENNKELIEDIEQDRKDAEIRKQEKPKKGDIRYKEGTYGVSYGE